MYNFSELFKGLFDAMNQLFKFDPREGAIAGGILGSLNFVSSALANVIAYFDNK